jgi:predicted DCC family thiol-disulfide oxidoreductase YuxK
MAEVTAQPRFDGGGSHLLLYDGVCGLCSRLVQFLLAHDRRRSFDFASLQSALGQSLVTGAGGDACDLSSFYVFANHRTERARVLTKGRAALFVAGELGWPWNVARALDVLPTVVLNGLYDLVARNRYRIFGRDEHCLIPSPDMRSRFVDR